MLVANKSIFLTVSFLRMIFDIMRICEERNDLFMNDSHSEELIRNQYNGIAKFDLIFTFISNAGSDDCL
jgi:hypothetical protein